MSTQDAPQVREWCCRHAWTLGYIAAVVTLLLALTLLGA